MNNYMVTPIEIYYLKIIGRNHKIKNLMIYEKICTDASIFIKLYSLLMI